jgi:3'(2'), 5'-bisphosphate nucleotidase
MWMLSDRDHEEAMRIAHGAGALLLELRARAAGDSSLGSLGDRMANDWIARELGSAFPQDRVRSEEGERSGRTVSASERLWVVDPLDGTREYAEGRDDWAVHVALVIDGVPVAGAVALPCLGLTLSSRPPQALAQLHEGPPRILISRTRPPREASVVAEALGGTLVPMGSAGAKAMAVVRGEAEVYLHSGGQYEWDSAAPVAVALAAGMHASRLDGSLLVYGRPEPLLPDLLICRRELASRVLKVLAARPC